MTTENTRSEQIRSLLTKALNPTLLELEDQSAEHEGHAGAKGGGHFALKIVSPDFNGKSAVERHKMIYSAIGHLMGSEIHALTIHAKTPEEI